MKLRAEIRKIEHVIKEDLDHCYELFSSFYQGTNFERFCSDFSQKKEVIILRDSLQIVRGFCTLDYYNFKHHGRCHRIIFTGDTIIHPDYWGTNALSFAFFISCFKQKLAHPTSQTWWFLISKGYKTYLKMANYVLNYYPRFDKETPTGISAMLKELSRKHYPNNYNDRTGLIEFEKGEHDFLKEGVADITQEQLEKYPKIKFFQRLNPEWQQGAELPCLGLIEFKLLIYNPVKMLMKKLRKTKRR